MPEEQRVSASVPEWLEKLASEGAEVPNGIDFIDCYAFISLRSIYGMVERGIIQRSAAGKMRSQLLSEYRNARGRYDLMVRSASLWKRIEPYSARYRDERTLENADAFVEAVYGVKSK
jgi:hypothetical protein